jgi:hypothetical protein
MGRPQFTNPVERPRDRSERAAELSTYAEALVTITAGGTNSADLTLPSGDAVGANGPKLIDRISMQQVGTSIDPLEAYLIVGDGGGTTLDRVEARRGFLQLNVDPSVRVPDGGLVSVISTNWGSTDVQLRAVVGLREVAA